MGKRHLTPKEIIAQCKTIARESRMAERTPWTAMGIMCAYVIMKCEGFKTKRILNITEKINELEEQWSNGKIDMKEISERLNDKGGIRIVKSIMHNKKDGTCYLCMLLNRDDSQKHTQEHHAIYGNAKRKLSEKYGLKVYLCIEHHTAGKQAVHFNTVNSMYIKKAAQKAFEDKYPELEFMKIFGKNYLEDSDSDRQQYLEEEEGFQLIADLGGTYGTDNNRNDGVSL